MSEEQRVRIRIHYNGLPNWLCRVEPDGAIRLTQNPTHAILLARDAARAQARGLRTKDPNITVEIVCFNGVVLDEGEQQVEFEPDQRAAVYDDVSLVRVIPGAAAATWFIRFPHSPYESIKGTTPESCLDKLNSHPWRDTLLKYAERFVPPAETPMDPDEILRWFQKEKMKGRQLRHGDR
jgi:hypothetical protein